MTQWWFGVGFSEQIHKISHKVCASNHQAFRFWSWKLVWKIVLGLSVSQQENTWYVQKPPLVDGTIMNINILALVFIYLFEDESENQHSVKKLLKWQIPSFASFPYYYFKGWISSSRKRNLKRIRAIRTIQADNVGIRQCERVRPLFLRKRTSYVQPYPIISHLYSRYSHDLPMIFPSKFTGQRQINYSQWLWVKSMLYVLAAYNVHVGST